MLVVLNLIRFKPLEPEITPYEMRFLYILIRRHSLCISKSAPFTTNMEGVYHRE